MPKDADHVLWCRLNHTANPIWEVRSRKIDVALQDQSEHLLEVLVGAFTVRDRPGDIRGSVTKHASLPVSL